jgi:tRNA U34 2-thiouridine synthase MnmA/TrmU
MTRRAISLLSGGLDSLLASRIVLDLGVELVGLHFVSPACNAIKDDDGHRAIKAGKELGIRVLVRDKGEEYLDIIKNPDHGYGRNMNPCIDCRIYMLKMAGQIMAAEDASFLVTGEVIGQRPMSQRRETISEIEKKSGLYGLILRPLSAKLLPITIPEREGVVEREKLLDVSGRSRKRQYELIRQYELKEFSCPAGGCLLTDPIFAGKLKDLFEHERFHSLRDIGLLRVGRHFRFNEKRVILGRNQEENDYLETFCSPPYSYVRPLNLKGPSGLLRGETDSETLQFVAALMRFYGKGSGTTIILEVLNGSRREYPVEPAEIDADRYRIKETS